jgi:hypothetical protein
MKTNLVILIPIVFLAGCSQKDKANQTINEATTKVEQLRKPFNPNYNIDTTAVTLYMTFKIKDGQITPKPIKAEIIPGKMPYQPMRGTFLLTCRDSLKKEVASYSIENPLVIRSCDDVGKPAISVMKTGTFSIRFPFSPTAMYLELLDNEHKEIKRVEIDLFAILKEYKIR